MLSQYQMQRLLLLQSLGALAIVFSTVSFTASVALVVASLIVAVAFEVDFSHNNLLFQLIGLTVSYLP